ncbi:MAG: Crp/Fnr family transcriptional regulator [Oscillospiraceae bacterium]|nr:Crp/Fnr family transcriptional regulator [Oscillospiraceae bacterium]
MQKIFEVAKNNPLFQGIACGDFEPMLQCLSARVGRYAKDDIILLSGDPVHVAGLVLCGNIKIIKEDISGNSTILASLTASELFGEVFACAEVCHSPVTIQATEETEILFLDSGKILTTCSEVCLFHARLIKNMVRLLAHKTLMLNQKIEILSKRTTREKLFCFFDYQRGAKRKFRLPFNREEMATYLCVDRSAMSNELCKMRDERLIRFHRNEFEIL